MDSKVCCVFQLAVLLGVALALAGPIIAGGSVEAVGLASKAAANATAGANAARQMMMAQATTTAKSTMGLEVHRRVLSSLSPSSLDRNRPVCLSSSCGARGAPYTRGCQKTYGCNPGT